ncbi:ABC transporter substrate-binding protein [Micromonospora coerulea]|uniref:ABC transporter substrate-binding protein n=1 Tax=Micromonospora coerulea TaxID=47856 RepID=UPI001907C02A|nr:sugar ABC transporter substrate-binding protein [Micromonospora veneta]
MRLKSVAALAIAMTVLLPATACSSSSDESGGPVKLTFSTYAWQKDTVAATKDIVASWNASHPDVQVQMAQVDADSVHDKLVTQFNGGGAPDIIHDESADIGGFAEQGYLADLSPLLSANTKSQVSQGVWDSVTFDGKVYGMPTLMQSYNVFVNTDLLAKAGVSLPTGDQPWTWDDFQAAAKKTTSGSTFGSGWGLKSPVSAIMSLSMNFNGSFFTTNGDKTELQFGDAEKQLLARTHAMIYDDKSLAPASTSMATGDVLPGFFGGKYAMIIAGNYNVQQIMEQAPKGFAWKMLPPLKGQSTSQAANPQTLSVASQSKHQKEAAQFIEYYANAENLAKLAQGDRLIPTTNDAAQAVLAQTKGENGWDTMILSGKSLAVAPFQKAEAYPQWKSQIATPAFQQFFANKISIDELGSQLKSGWQTVSTR